MDLVVRDFDPPPPAEHRLVFWVPRAELSTAGGKLFNVCFQWALFKTSVYVFYMLPLSTVTTLQFMLSYTLFISVLFAADR